MKSMYMWTFQSIDRWQALQRDGILRGAPISGKPIAEEVYYCWMRDQMSNRIGAPPDEIVYPLWAWYWELRATGPGPKYLGLTPLYDEYSCMRLKIDIPQSVVLLSDFARWDDILFFHGFVPGGNWGQLSILEKDLKSAGFVPDLLLDVVDSEEIERRQKELQLLGFSSFAEHKYAALQHPSLGPRIQRTWEAVFNLVAARRLNYVMQATFWELRLEQVLNVKEFRRRHVIPSLESERLSTPLGR